MMKPTKRSREADEAEEPCASTSKKVPAAHGSSSKKPKQQPQPQLPLEELNVFHYVQFKILDSIGFPGAYRKFMLKRKEQGAPWAVQMGEHVAQVLAGVKELTLLEQDIKKSSVFKNLDVVWQHVIESNVPPSDQSLTIGTCLITGKPNLPCIVIRGKGRGANNFTVCSKFAPFLYHLWMVYKMDMLIKVYTRKALEDIDPQGALLLTDIAQHFKDHRQAEVHSLARALHAAYTHVYRSAKGGLMAVV
jgi:hypothetical protein